MAVRTQAKAQRLVLGRQDSPTTPPTQHEHKPTTRKTHTNAMPPNTMPSNATMTECARLDKAASKGSRRMSIVGSVQPIPNPSTPGPSTADYPTHPAVLTQPAKRRAVSLWPSSGGHSHFGQREQGQREQGQREQGQGRPSSFSTFQRSFCSRQRILEPTTDRKLPPLAITARSLTPSPPLETYVRSASPKTEPSRRRTVWTSL
jgi:hypothetical protein